METKIRKFEKAVFYFCLKNFPILTERIRYSKISKIPNHLYIEPTNQCNLKCVMCPYKMQERKKSFMDMDLYRKIIDDAANLGIPWIHLWKFGEPLLHPQIFEMVRYAKEKGIGQVGITTNGVLLDGKKVLESGMDFINFSVDSLNPRTYKKIRGTELSPILKNIQLLLEKRGLERKPRITVLVTDTPINHNEISDIRNYWEELVDEVIIIKCTNYKGIPEIPRKQIMKHACNEPFNRMVVLSNGDVGCCCPDYDGKLVVGNMHEENISEVWNGKRLNEVRKMHIHHNFNISPCNECSVITQEIEDIFP